MTTIFINNWGAFFSMKHLALVPLILSLGCAKQMLPTGYIPTSPDVATQYAKTIAQKSEPVTLAFFPYTYIRQPVEEVSASILPNYRAEIVLGNDSEVDALFFRVNTLRQNGDYCSEVFVDLAPLGDLNGPYDGFMLHGDCDGIYDPAVARRLERKSTETDGGEKYFSTFYLFSEDPMTRAYINGRYLENLEFAARRIE